jgi:hypothetical protein
MAASCLAARGGDGRGERLRPYGPWLKERLGGGKLEASVKPGPGRGIAARVVTRAEGGPSSPGLVRETLPAGQEDEEYAILEKFISSLRHFEGRDISGLYRRGDRWPDFETGEGGGRLGIELTWVTYEPHDELRRIEEQYARRVDELLADVRPQLAGLHIQLEDDYQDPPYPRLASGEGEAVARAIAGLIRSNAPKLQTLPVWIDPERPPVVSQARETGPTGVWIGYAVHRFAATESRAEPLIRFFGSFPIEKSLLESLLWRAIERKLKKQYGPYEGRLWLLVWSAAWPLGVPPSAEAALARQRISRTAHRFDEIWSMFPYAGQDLGSIERVWP